MQGFAHRRWSIVTAVAAALALLALVSVSGHYGGELTRGSGFLAEYAPAWLRSLMGTEPRVTSLEAADPYHDVVQPLLELRCGTCHNREKLRGGYSVDDYDSTLVGGDTGLAVLPGNVQASELLYRISLPPDDDAFMPAEGKTPLTAQQVAILRWWVEAGAPRATTLDALAVPPEVEPLLAAELGLAAPAAAEAAVLADAPADPRVVAELAAAGLLARPVSQSDAGLVVSQSSPGTPLGETAIAALAAARESIVDLNLAGTALDDAGLAAIGELPAATHLRLARNRLTDVALTGLARSPRLEHLNLYGNAGITDAGVETLAAASTLRELYLWQTGVTPAGAARLRARRPETRVDLGIAVADGAR